MQKRNIIALTFLISCFLSFPVAISSQPKPTFTRTTLARMDVLSRAVLFERTISNAARKERVDPLILWTIAYNETRFRPWLTSPKNAQGLMQFIPATAVRFGLAYPYEPNASIYAAARYVKYLGGLFDGRLDSVLAAYNAGEGTVQAYLQGRTIRSNGKVINPSARRTSGGVPPYRETANYVAQGKRVYRWLEMQGRFRGFRNEAAIEAMAKTEPASQDVSGSKGPASTFATTVLYDPRSGSRYLVGTGGQDRLQPLDEVGPVVISPGVRGLASQKARSTFAGADKP